MICITAARFRSFWASTIWPRPTSNRRMGQMLIALSDEQVRWLRLRAQRLTSPPATAVAGIVRALCGLQAQDAPAAMLGVRVRSAGLLAANVERARIDERSVVRTWAMRGTLHLLATERSSMRARSTLAANSPALRTRTPS